jgi:hypothetical protein
MTLSATAEKPAAPVEIKRPRADRHSMKLEEQHRRRWFLQAPLGTTQEDVRYPEFFADLARQFARHDVVTVLAPDESWEMELCVEAVRAAEVECTVRKLYSRKGVGSTHTPVAPGFHAEYRAGMGWCVIRQSDNFAVERGHGLESIAIAAWQRAQPRPVL